MAGHPADIGRTPEDVFFLEIEDVLVGRGSADQVAARCVQHALRLARGARRIQDVERVLGVERFGLDDLIARLVQRAVPPDVAALLHRHLLRVVGAVDHQDVLDRRTGLERLVHGVFERDLVAPPPTTVGGDGQRRGAIVHAIGDAVCAEAREDDGVRRPDSGAGEHGDGQLGDHSEIDRHPVALIHSQAFERRRAAVDLAVQIAIRQDACIAQLAFEDDRGFVASPALQVAVDAVVARVHLCADEPLGLRSVPLQHAVPWLEPVDQTCCLVGPEAFGIPLSAFVDLRIVPIRPGLEFFRWWVAAILLQEGVDRAINPGLIAGWLGGCHFRILHLRWRMVTLADAASRVLAAPA